MARAYRPLPHAHNMPIIAPHFLFMTILSLMQIQPDLARAGQDDGFFTCRSAAPKYGAMIWNKPA